MGEVHNHKKNMDNLLVSVEKFFGLNYNLVSLSKLDRYFNNDNYKNLIILSYDCLDVKVFSKYVLSDSFLGKHIFFNITVPKVDEDKLMHLDLIKKINDVENCYAYGVFPFGVGAYTTIEEANKRVINLSLGKEKKLIYVSYKGFYKNNCDGIEKINQDCMELCNKLDNSVILILGESINYDLKVPLCVVKRISNSENIRLATIKDINVVNELVQSSWNNRINCRRDLFKQRRKFTEFEFYNFCSRARGDVCFVCEISEEVVGILLAKINIIKDEECFADRSYIIIENIYVKEDFRRRKIGTKLYNSICEYAKKNKIMKIQFNVYKFEEDLICFIQSLNGREQNTVYELDIFDVK